MKKSFKILLIVVFSLMSLNIFSQTKTLNNVTLKGNLTVEGYTDLGDSAKVSGEEYLDYIHTNDSIVKLSKKYGVDSVETHSFNSINMSEIILGGVTSSYIPTADTIKKSAVDTTEEHTFTSLSSGLYNVGSATIDDFGQDIVFSKNLWFTSDNDTIGYKSGSTKYSFFTFGQNRYRACFSTGKRYDFDDDVIIGITGAGPTYSFALYNDITGITYRPVYTEQAGWGRISSNKLAVWCSSEEVITYSKDSVTTRKVLRCNDSIYYKGILSGIPSQPAVILIDSVGGVLYADSTSAASGFGLKDGLIDIVEFLRDTINGELGWKYINEKGDTLIEHNTKGNLWEVNQKLFWGVEHAYRYIEEHENKLNELYKKIKVLGLYVIILISGLIAYIIAKEIR
jgi:hypothetical protein